ncbi:hypothetical protein [Sporosarcina sp. FSL K6-5500]|uniref:hypothetical protein n=1 Tax=Sporosarcina sp. FSL K6-5500 TaxID=2921558 RepID=UPI0030FA6973
MTSNRNLPFALLTILLIALLFAFYFYFIKPVKEETKSAEVSLTTAKQEVKALQARSEAIEWEDDGAGELELMNKLPKNRELPNIIQLLQEAEFISESKIQSIVFNDYDGNIQDSSLNAAAPETETAGETDESSVDDPVEAVEGNVATDQTPVSEIAQVSLPENLMLLTLETIVVHKDYEHFLRFIDEIEKNDRIIKIDSVKFSLAGEETGSENTETMSSTIQLTTFYLK